MKKITWIIALLAALALIFVGCPGEGDDEEDNGGNPSGGGGDGEINLTEVFSATGTTQDKATVTVSGSTATFAFKGNTEIWGELVTPEGALWNVSDYTGIKFEYKSPINVTILVQDANDVFIFKNGSDDGWGAVSFVDNWTEISLPFSTLTGDNNWIDSTNTTPFSKSVRKLMFQITGADSGDKIEIRNFAAY